MKHGLAAAIFIAALSFALVPVLTDPFNGYAPDQFPVPTGPVPLQPAGYAFALWGVIYLWLIAGAAYGLWRHATDPEWTPMRAPLLASLLIGAAWIPIALRAPVTSTAMIIAMLIFALIALWRAPNTALWARGPVALYAGWLTAASNVVLATVLTGYGILSALQASFACLALALTIALPVTWSGRSLAYPAAVVWALVGIVLINRDATPALALGAAFGAVLIAALGLWRNFRPI